MRQSDKEPALKMAAVLSVTFTPWTLPSKALALSMMGVMSVPFGGLYSTVVTNSPDSRTSRNRRTPIPQCAPVLAGGGPADAPPAPTFAAARCADSRVFCRSIAIVIGPTPPGTGEIHAAFRLTASKSTSPTNFPSAVDFEAVRDRKSTRLNSHHLVISYAVFFLKKKKTKHNIHTCV